MLQVAWVLRRYLSAGLLGGIGIFFVIAIVLALNELPSTQAVNQQMDVLVRNLVRLHATHIYADYWTCDKIAFVSNEQIICAVVYGNLKLGYNRYAPYYTQVSSDANAAYVYSLNSTYLSVHSDNPAPSAQAKMLKNGVMYRRVVMDGYIIYLRE